MHAPTDNVTRSRSVLTRFPFWSRLFRHPRVGMAVFFTAGSWNLFLGLLMLSYGYWLGLLSLAASAVLFWAGTCAYQINQSRPAASLAGAHGR
jgi:hypothetical protein